MRTPITKQRIPLPGLSGCWMWPKTIDKYFPKGNAKRKTNKHCGTLSSCKRYCWMWKRGIGIEEEVEIIWSMGQLLSTNRNHLSRKLTEHQHSFYVDLKWFMCGNPPNRKTVLQLPSLIGWAASQMLGPQLWALHCIFKKQFLLHGWVFRLHACPCTMWVPDTHRCQKKGIRFPGTGDNPCL